MRGHGVTCRLAPVVGVWLLSVVPGAAQEPAASPAPPAVDVTGFVDAYYGYNLNGVDPTLRTYDVQHNTFSLSLAQVSFAKVPTAESRIGFRTDLDFGKAADLTASFEPASDGKEIGKHIMQAYLSLLTGKVQWDFGKFVTPMGAEVVPSQDNWNYSRSILFGYAIPFYHLGLRATYAATPKVTLGAMLVNGWNNASEINDNKTVHLSVTLKPNASLTWVGNYMVGKETAGSSENRQLFDTTLSVAATSKFSLMANFDYGKEGTAPGAGGVVGGIAAYAKFQARPSWALVGRYEYLDDTKGGFMTLGTKGQSLTVTSDHLVAGGLRARLEYRTDFANEAVFPQDGGPDKKRKSQTTLTVGLVCAFAGKI